MQNATTKWDNDKWANAMETDKTSERKRESDVSQAERGREKVCSGKKALQKKTARFIECSGWKKRLLVSNRLNCRIGKMLTESSCGQITVWIGTKINNKQNHAHRTFFCACVRVCVRQPKHQEGDNISNNDDTHTQTKKWHSRASKRMHLALSVPFNARSPNDDRWLHVKLFKYYLYFPLYETNFNNYVYCTSFANVAVFTTQTNHSMASIGRAHSSKLQHAERIETNKIAFKSAQLISLPFDSCDQQTHRMEKSN